ncbi:MAG: type II toxin-antitoxin system RelB/DinJ family antitoxin [Patescibacteria group bacterium]
MHSAVINIKTDPKLKKDMWRVAQEMGLPVSTILNAMMRDVVRERRVVFSAPPALNRRTQRLLQGIDRDIKAGKNADGPFSPKEAAVYLEHL